MSAVKADAHVMFQRVREIIIVRTYYEALRADAEQFAFESVDKVLFVVLLLENLVKAVGEKSAVVKSVRRIVFPSVGNPEVAYARFAQCFA